MSAGAPLLLAREPVARTADPAALDAAYATCAAATRAAKTNFAWAFALLPHEVRRGIRVCYAYSRALDDAVDDAGTLAEKRARLDGLRERLAAAWDGAPDGPLFLALADVARRHAIPRHLFDELAAGVAMDLTATRYATFEALRPYCYRVASVVGLICLRLFGCDDPRAEAPAVDLGLAMQLTNILRDLREDAARDRIYLPADELARFGYAEADLRAGVRDDRFRALMTFQLARARAAFDRSEALDPLLARRARVCPKVLREGYRAVLRRIEARDFDVFGPRVSVSTPGKLWIAARCFVRARFL